MLRVAGGGQVIAFVEDDLRRLPFVLNVVVYFFAVLLIDVLVTRRPLRSKRNESGNAQ